MFAGCSNTQRHLATRVREHGYANSAVYDHLDGSQVVNKFSVNLFKIVDSEEMILKSLFQIPQTYAY